MVELITVFFVNWFTLCQSCFVPFCELRFFKSARFAFEMALPIHQMTDELVMIIYSQLLPWFTSLYTLVVNHTSFPHFTLHLVDFTVALKFVYSLADSIITKFPIEMRIYSSTNILIN